MADLTAKQRAHLKSLAHRLKPVVHVGKEGATEELAGSVLDALQTRELLKVKVLEAAPTDVLATGQELAERLEDVHLVQVIGRTVVLYRRHPEAPEIRLPPG